MIRNISIQLIIFLVRLAWLIYSEVQFIEDNRLLFREFLDNTEFPDPERISERGSKSQYPK